ncbi:GntR family transcriptional regulator [Georgenia sp. AZ-5]|uniref:GntR family transcriptional regulator n=1 Tax=Georgenia sp. AZ-5 TaxID=3367526 RepID=UPI00375518A0
MDTALDTATDTPRDTATDTPRHTPHGGAARTGSLVYTRLRSDIRAGRLSPWDRLTESGLCARFGVSRTPVREALTRLVAEGLLERHTDGLALVVPDLPTVLGLYELRLTLELRGLRRVVEGLVELHDTGLLLEQRARWRALEAAAPAPAPRLAADDEQFHLALLAAAGEPVLVDALQSVSDKIRAIRVYGYLSEARVADAVRGHLEILDLVLARDLDGAEDALRRHVESSRTAAVARASEAIAALRMTDGYRTAVP